MQKQPNSHRRRLCGCPFPGKDEPRGFRPSSVLGEFGHSLRVRLLRLYSHSSLTMRASLRIDPRRGPHGLLSRALSILGAGAGDEKEMQSPAGILLHSRSDDQGALGPGSQPGPSPRWPRRAALHRGHQPSTAHLLPNLHNKHTDPESQGPLPPSSPG